MQRVRRVRTTQELVQELAIKRSASPGLPTSNRSSFTAEEDVVQEETREELMTRFFDSQDGPSSESKEVVSPPTSLGVPSPPSESSASKKESVEDVLARLPPIDVEAVLGQMAREQEDEEEEDDGLEMEGLIPVKKPDPVVITDDMISKLNDEQAESFNGNFDHDGNFKEWHEVVSKSSVGGDLIHILPYSVID